MYDRCCVESARVDMRLKINLKKKRDLIKVFYLIVLLDRWVSFPENWSMPNRKYNNLKWVPFRCQLKRHFILDGIASRVTITIQSSRFFL